VRYLLDTNICSWLMRKGPRREQVDAHIAALPPDARLYASIIAEGEIRYGAEIGPPTCFPSRWEWCFDTRRSYEG
jgi:predicted nucleic acid-binding protein